MRIAEERSLMAELAQEVAHAGIVLETPSGKPVGNRWISRAQGVTLVANARSSSDRNTAGSAFAPIRNQSLRSPFGPRSSGGTTPAALAAAAGTVEPAHSGVIKPGRQDREGTWNPSRRIIDRWTKSGQAQNNAPPSTI